MLLKAGLFASLLTFVAADAVCYGGSGNQDPSLKVCDPTAAISGCCNSEDYCFSNGLCQAPKSNGYTTYAIHGCTAVDGTTGSCIPWAKCHTRGVGVTDCGNNKYCCYGLGGCDCGNSTQTFTLSPGKIITTIASSEATTSTSAASRSSGTTSATASATSSTNAAINNNSTNTVAIGAGVGVGVGVVVILLVALGVWLCMRKRKARRATGGETTAAVAGAGTGAASGYHANDAKAAVASPQQTYSPAYAPVYGRPQQYTPAPPSELPTHETPAEMAAGKTANSMHGAPARYT